MSLFQMKYDMLLNGTHVIESSLHKNLMEHLNAEIVLSTITDISVAVEWLKHTFLYIRVMKNPKHYGPYLPFLLKMSVVGTQILLSLEMSNIRRIPK